MLRDIVGYPLIPQSWNLHLRDLFEYHWVKPNGLEAKVSLLGLRIDLLP